MINHMSLEFKKKLWDGDLNLEFISVCLHLCHETNEMPTPPPKKTKKLRHVLFPIFRDEEELVKKKFNGRSQELKMSRKISEQNKEEA